jgi:hypothetical protein
MADSLLYPYLASFCRPDLNLNTSPVIALMVAILWLPTLLSLRPETTVDDGSAKVTAVRPSSENLPNPIEKPCSL